MGLSKSALMLGMLVCASMASPLPELGSIQEADSQNRLVKRQFMGGGYSQARMPMTGYGSMPMAGGMQGYGAMPMAGATGYGSMPMAGSMPGSMPAYGAMPGTMSTYPQTMYGGTQYMTSYPQTVGMPGYYVANPQYATMPVMTIPVSPYAKPLLAQSQAIIPPMQQITPPDPNLPSYSPAVQLTPSTPAAPPVTVNDPNGVPIANAPTLPGQSDSQVSSAPASPPASPPGSPPASPPASSQAPPPDPSSSVPTDAAPPTTLSTNSSTTPPGQPATLTNFNIFTDNKDLVMSNDFNGSCNDPHFQESKTRVMAYIPIPMLKRFIQAGYGIVFARTTCGGGYHKEASVRFPTMDEIANATDWRQFEIQVAMCKYKRRVNAIEIGYDKDDGTRMSCGREYRRDNVAGCRILTNLLGFLLMFDCGISTA